VSGRDQRNSADESGKIATVYLPSALAILFIVRVLAQMWTRGIVTDTAGVVSETATHLWSGLFTVPSRLALLVAKPIANAAAAPPRTTRRGRSLHPRLRGALPPRLPLSIVRCGDPSAHSFIRRQLVSSGNPRMASVVLKSWYGLSSQPDPSLSISISITIFIWCAVDFYTALCPVSPNPSVHSCFG